MALLYPPYIEGIIPAFYGKILKVPFLHNSTINKKDYNGFVVKFKEVNTNTELFVEENGTEDIGNKAIVFNISDFKINKLRENSFYKIQVAYRFNKDYGYFSTIGVVKYTTEPKLELIRGDQSTFDANNINVLTQEVVGQYTNTDPYEKLYSTKLTIRDSKGNIFYQTEELIHNNFGDDNNITKMVGDSITESSIVQYENYSLYKQLQDGETYTIQLVGSTINGLNCVSPAYQVRNAYTFDGFYGYYMSAERNYEDGSVEVYLQGDIGVEKDLKGLFLLSRADIIKEPNTWYPIKHLALDGIEDKPFKIFEDLSVEQGGVYQYAIQQYNGNYMSNKMYSNKVTADFEDMFLWDGKRQLKLKFNPKISSFKTTKLESKIDTVGGVYPIFFRNGYANYKEFPISALLSYLCDENNKFMLDEDFGLTKSTEPTRRSTPGSGSLGKGSENRFDVSSIEYQRLLELDGRAEESSSYITINGGDSSHEPTLILDGDSNELTDGAGWGEIETISTPWDASRNTNLTPNNYVAERIFKMKVLDWLNDGKPKLFRSPAEGNYIVRLMNVSLSPNDTLGRMLHTFNSTAYEVAEINFENLKKHAFINLDVPSMRPLLVPYSFLLSDMDAYSGTNAAQGEEPYRWLYLPSEQVYYPQFTNMPLGTKIRFTDSSGVQSVIEVFMRDSYIVDEEIPFSKIELQFPDDVKMNGLFNVFYTSTPKTSLDYVKNISFKTIPMQSFSDDEKEIDMITKIESVNNFKYSYIDKTISFNHNEISSVKYLKFEKKDFNLPNTAEEQEQYKIKIWTSHKRDINNLDDKPNQIIDLSDLDSYTFPIVHGDFYNIVIGTKIIGYISYDLNVQRVEISTNDIIKEKIDYLDNIFDYIKE